jgi:hypothetical protein
MGSKLAMLWEVAPVTYFKMPSGHLSGGLREPQTRRSVSQRSYEYSSISGWQGFGKAYVKAATTEIAYSGLKNQEYFLSTDTFSVTIILESTASRKAVLLSKTLRKVVFLL